MTSVESTSKRSTPRRAAAAAFAGGSLEYYDFFIYGTASALVFNELFFTDLSPAIGMVASYATLAIGYIVRPFGAVVFGHIGDRHGRKVALQATLLTMGLATVAVGLLPTQVQIGEGAALLLVAVRIIQGLGIGGELGNASALSVESAPPGRRAFFGSFASSGPFSGMVLSTGVYAALSVMPRETFLAWGWRLPFLFSAALIVVAYLIRRHITEPEESSLVRIEGKIDIFPFRRVVRSHKIDVLLTTLTSAAPGTVFYIVTVFGLSYGSSQYDVDQSQMLILVTVAAAVLVLVVPFWGWVSDRIARRHELINAGLAVEGVSTFVYFWALSTGNVLGILASLVVVLGLGHALVNAITPVFFIEMYPIEIRASAVSLGQQLGGAINGLSPLVAASIVAVSPGAWGWISVYAGVLCSISILATHWSVVRHRANRTRTSPATAGAPGATRTGSLTAVAGPAAPKS
ncbi:MFS transporter [Rhodococcus sp. ACPA1]|uniref:MFS transporter n=1 Tax=Rhodococcus sp. ACPA1 TaxID=2028572 RepID=UPI0015CC9F54|nr:MFS transporter [Rhodococcus sp. ACPA1]